MSSAPFDRVVVVVLDSVGVGDAPDAREYGDSGADTVGHIHQTVGLTTPNLARLGLFAAARIPGHASPEAAHGRLTERSKGKDTMTGHFELAGLVLDTAYPTYPEGFPGEITDEFARRIGRGILGNKAASGTEILDELGSRHLATGLPIVYTSADSVFQIAAHVDKVALDELYRWCRIAREILAPPHHVARVIARPFTGAPGAFERTKDRKDFALPPPAPTIRDHARAAGLETVSIGKIGDIFSMSGIRRSNPAKGNEACADAILAAMGEDFRGLVFANLVDFDTLYGHRRDPAGYRDCIEAFDRRIPALLDRCRERDLVLITADHGNDPTFAGTDHTRERVPILGWHRRVRTVDLGTRASFADLARTIDDNFGLDGVKSGASFLRELV